MSMNQPTGRGGRTAHQEDLNRLKERYDWLQALSNDEWGEVVFLGGDDTMSSGEEYFDISNPERGVFQGRDGEHPPEGSRYVPKNQIPDNVWHKLIGPYQ